MKKLLFTFTLILISVISNAQIFTDKMVLDKFDDVILTSDTKTLITKNDTIFTFEEKGKTIEKYRTNVSPYSTIGDENNIVNLVGNIYGYEESWLALNVIDIPKVTELYSKINSEGLEEDSKLSLLKKLNDDYVYTIVHRIVTTQYGHTKLSEYYWIAKIDHQGHSVKRIIYSREF